MAPEQFRGQAVLSTDLYGLGTTLLFLLTRKPPSDLPQRKLKIDFRSQVSISKDFADWLEKMLEPFIEDRFPSAKEALSVLWGEQPLTTSPSQKLHPPKNSTISISEADGRLVIAIGPVWLSNYRSLLVATLLVANFFSNIFGLFGLLMLLTFLFGAGSRTKIEIDKEYFCIKQYLLGLCYHKRKVRTEEINQVKLMGNNSWATCLIQWKLRKYSFGLFLSQQEKLWLVASINTFLEKIREQSALL